MRLPRGALWLGAGAWAVAGCGLGTGTNSFAPVVDITSPLTQVVRGRVAFSANVLDDTGVSRVLFLVDGVLLAEDSSAPFITDWDTTTSPDGEHTIRVEAEDIEGNRSAKSRVVRVNNATPN